MEHPNFIIDEFIDKHVKHNFEDIFEGCLEMLDQVPVSVEEKRNLALHQVFDYKENCKLHLKEVTKLREKEKKEDERKKVRQGILKKILKKKKRRPEDLRKSCLMNNMEDYILETMLNSNLPMCEEMDKDVPQNLN